MRVSDLFVRPILLTVPCLVASLAACGDSGSTMPQTTPDVLQFTAKDVGSLDSTGRAINQANPGNGTLKSLVDSTLLVLTAGIEAKRLDVTTNLTTKPLYFVGVHRAVTRGATSFSTWTIVGMDSPSNLTSIVEVSGFAQNQTATPPTTVSGTIGDGSGLVNGLLLAVGDGGAVTQWNGATGTVSFTSTPSTAACPNFPASGNITCTLETIRARFTVNAPNGNTGPRSASVSTEVEIPTMRLTYTF